MDDRRTRILDDLRGLVAGDLYFDPVGRAPYAHDASLYEIDPMGVVVPRSVDDVITTVRYASEKSLPVHARGAGTGLAGESLGPGLVLDFSRYCRRVLSIGPESVVVQPGVVLGELNSQLAPLGRRLGPDPTGSATCTIGGIIAGDAAGARSLKYGTTADAVISLEVVFANGEAASLGLEPWPTTEQDPEDFKGSVVRRVALHLNWHGDLIARKAPKSSRNRAGYALGAIGRPDGMDLARLIVGSEGTLALVTSATLRTVPLPTAQAAVLIPFGRLTDAAEAAVTCLAFEPAACELFDWRRLYLARDADPILRRWVPETAEAALVVEFEGDDIQVVRQQSRSLRARFLRHPGVVAEPAESTRREECERLLNLGHLIQPPLMRARGFSRPVPIIEDVAVPIEALADYLQRLQAIFKAYGVNWILHAHAGDGQAHARPFLDLVDPEDLAKVEPLASDTYDAALALGGTISGEHGCGLVRSQFIHRQYGELAQVFREIKYAFDPQNILNPGKIVGADPHQMIRHLKVRHPSTGTHGELTQGALPVLNAPLAWTDRSRVEQIEQCNGCGDCRSREPGLRMCPTFRALRSEPASPRSKVNLLRQVAVGVLDPRHWGSEELRANADLCVHCGLCRIECPAGIDVSSLMVEAKAAYVENHGLTPTDWTFSHVDLWTRWASRIPILSNAILGNKQARWLLETFFGLSRHRVLPRAQRRSFLSRAARMGLTRPRPQEPGPRVAYFVDLFANHFDQELAEAVVAVLRHAGVNVFVPPGQQGCGMSALVVGDLERARSQLNANLRILGDAVRDGYTVVCSEPTAALMLKTEALKLSDNADAELVAGRTMDVGQYLAGLAERGSLPEPTESIPLKIGYHQPCHLRALEVGTPGLDLIRRIPGVDVEFIDRGCSGAAGIFGLTRRNFRVSLRAGRELRKRLKDPDLQIGATECSTCRMQMEQGLFKRTVHPMKLLALGYGLNPGLRRHVTEPKPRHRIS